MVDGVSCPSDGLDHAPFTAWQDEVGKRGEGWIETADHDLPAIPSMCRDGACGQPCYLRHPGVGGMHAAGGRAGLGPTLKEGRSCYQEGWLQTEEGWL